MIHAIFDKVEEGAWVHIFPEGKIVQHEGESIAMGLQVIDLRTDVSQYLVILNSARRSTKSASRGDWTAEVGRGKAHRTCDHAADCRARVSLQHGAAHAARREQLPHPCLAADDPVTGHHRGRAAVVRRPICTVRERPRRRGRSMGNARA